MNQHDSDIYYAANPNASARLIGASEAVLYNPDTGKEKFINLLSQFAI